MEDKLKKLKENKGIIGLVLVVAIFITIFLSTGFNGVNILSFHNKVKDEALTVTAVVSKHGDYSSNDEGRERTVYHSYITYTVDSETYENIMYQSVSDKRELLPVGAEVDVRVAPENPAILVDELEKEGYSAVILCAMMLALVFFCFVGAGKKKKK